MKAAWTLVRPRGTTADDFRAFLLERLPGLVTSLAPTASRLSLTVREPETYCTATLGGVAIDALVELTVADETQALDPVNELLAAESRAIQGWAVVPSVVYDVSVPPPLGRPSFDVSSVIFIERLDGTSREHFSSNWYRHAGITAEGATSTNGETPVRERLDEDGPTTRYAQNRLIEPLTPTEWVVHGYSQLHAPWVIPSLPSEPYERFRGEDPFDRWPPRLLQGREYRMV